MVDSRKELIQEVAGWAEAIGLTAERNINIGRTIWGANRKIDVLISEPNTGERLGVICRFQESSGTTYEKIPAEADDLRAWPIRGIVVFAGPGFTGEISAFLRATGVAISLDELDVWGRLFFGRALS